ncbi:uncharacterized protein LOC123270132 [Cotesia glomerata]|uniref:uncharacterized protein LOC123270132 n=1 Tax=Cotesia glomerata TaxID=32391 RepID=UPI001D00795E|nr:uncharacterized protein LOC123270132 [Cotesia glomerata]
MEVDAQQTNFPPIGGRPVAPVNTHTCRGRINSLPTVTGQQSPMERLGSKIEELAEFIKDKRNLHHELRKIVASIATAYKLANKPATKTARTTQTSPDLNKKSQTFSVTPEKTQHREEKNKKRPLSTPSPSSEIDKPAHKKTAWGDTWTKADLLKEIKAKVNPTETGVDIKSIKQTKRGGVLLEIGRKTEDTTAFTAAIKTATANIGTVRTLTPKATIEILDLDAITTENDVREALKRDFTDSLEIKRVNLTKPTRRGNRAAFCEIDEASAFKILDKARIMIGWVNCRIRPVVKVTRCIRCLGYGHATNSCKGPDRSKCCFKCGGGNHKAADCVEQPKCFFCTEEQEAPDSLCHIPASGAYKVFRTALAEATKGQK